MPYDDLKMNLEKIREIFVRADNTLQTAKFGLEDLLDSSPPRRMSGLRNLIVFGRSVTLVLQNLRSAAPEGEFDKWYEPYQEAMKADPLMRYFVEARNVILKQGRLNVMSNSYFHSFSSSDLDKLGRRPAGATGFFVGDTLGGSGWRVPLPDGTVEKYYVTLPASVAEVKQQFFDLPAALDPELRGATVEELSRRYIGKLDVLVQEAKRHFLGGAATTVAKNKSVPYLRRIK
jgi:hypothetical protein